MIPPGKRYCRSSATSGCACAHKPNDHQSDVLELGAIVVAGGDLNPRPLFMSQRATDAHPATLCEDWSYETDLTLKTITNP